MIGQVLKIIIVGLVDWIGFDTHSEVMVVISDAVFVVYYLNTLVILFINADVDYLIP